LWGERRKKSKCLICILTKREKKGSFEKLLFDFGDLLFLGAAAAAAGQMFGEIAFVPRTRN
jgi:hypothetical protein